MLPIFDVFVQIALRRRGPEDLPDSRLLLWATAGLYAVVQTLLAVTVYHSAFALARSLLIDLALLCACVWILLRFTNHVNRFGQTLTAMFGTGALLGMCMLPFNLWAALVSAPGQPATLPTLGLLAVVSWSLAVNGHIFSRALSIPFVVGLTISIAYFFLNYLVFIEFGPELL